MEAAHKWAETNGTKVYKTYIRESVVVKESQAKRQPLYIYAPNATATQDYAEWAKEFMKERN